MSTSNSEPFLPPELILSIIECLIPSGTTPIALPSSHPTTRTLLSLARTSSITYPTACRLLYTHCLWIDNPSRLQLLKDSLTASPSTNNHARLSEPILEHITSLYLSYTAIEDPAPALNLLTLFTHLAPSLRRLVVDMPFRNFDFGDKFNTQSILRRGFSQLTALEEFCSVRDELYLDLFNSENQSSERWRWSVWPKLRILALYNKDVGAEGFWEDVGKLGGLETLVFTRADGLEEVDMKVEWRRSCGDEKRRLEVLLVNVESQHRVPVGKANWKDGDKVKVREANVPTSYYGDEDPIVLCQEWVKRRMLRGEAPVDWT